MSNLWVIGDSTVSKFDDKYYYPRFGYGTKLQEYLDDKVHVINLALSGRSSLSYIKEPEYQQLLDGMKAGDYLLIGFGHNDEKAEEERHTSGLGSYKEEGSFAHSLYSHYIVEADKVGCQVLLCTPIVRRTNDGVWEEEQLHITKSQGRFKGGNYPEAVRMLGKELNIPVVDMTQMTKELYDAMGCEKTCYLHAWLSNKKASVDNTHINTWGARVIAYMCLKRVKELNINGLSEHIVHLEKDAPLPAKENYLISNSEYKPVVYNNNLKKSELWESAGIWNGTVFGDIPPNWCKEDFILEPVKAEGVYNEERDKEKQSVVLKAANDKLHIAVKNNSGKISEVTDGIAMYYTKVPAASNFKLTATVMINDYFNNNQVSFGLMARDEMYIDMQIGELLGDYVAAAPLLLTREFPMNCFARRSGKLIYGNECKHVLKPKDKIKLCIESTNDGYACTFGEEETVTGGFDFKLTSIDPEYIYVGMFASRNADVIFSDIHLDVY